MSTLKVTHLQNENGTGPAMSLAVGGGVTFAGITTFHSNVDLGSNSLEGSLQVATGATISGSTNTITGFTNGSERFRVSNDGTFRIGTDSTNVEIAANLGVDINDGAINLYQATTNVNAAPFIISTDVGGTEIEKLRVTAAGNVGIGTNYVGNISNRAQLVLGGDTGGLLDFNVGGDTEGRMFATDAVGLTIRASQSDGEIVFQTGGSNERARITSDGLKLASGKGINFSAYATSGNPSSNLLDDYEEGTFTPSLRDAAGGNAATVGIRVGTYVRIGQLCHMSIRLSQITSVAGMTSGNAIFIDDLPFNIKNVTTDTIYVGSCELSNFNVATGTYQVSPFVNASSSDQSSIRIFKSIDNAGHDSLKVSEIVAAASCEVFVNLVVPVV